MKFITLAALALTAATPAMAQDNAAFTGAKVEATVGYNDINNSFDANDVVYGGAVGFDVPVGNKFTLGVEANTSNVFEDQRQIGAAARIGYAFTPTTLGYVKGGYNNYRDVARIGNRSFRENLDGAVVGVGIEHKISRVTYLKAEYRYSDFDGQVGDSAAVVGVGLRF